MVQMVAHRQGIYETACSFGQPMCEGVFITDPCKDVVEGIFILLPIGKLDAIIGEHGVKFVRHSRNEIA